MDTVSVQLKPKKTHKTSVFKQNIWPSVVVKALDYLINTSKMYQHENITMDNNWLDSLGYENETNKQYLDCQNEETCESDYSVSNRNN